MNDKYITVSEFAKRANISKQRVYQLLNKRLKEFVQEVDGKKMLDIRALESFSIQDTCSSVVQEVEPDAKQEASALDLLKTTIDMLQKQLEEKDRTIHELTEALKNEQLQ